MFCSAFSRAMRIFDERLLLHMDWSWRPAFDAYETRVCLYYVRILSFWHTIKIGNKKQRDIRLHMRWHFLHSSQISPCWYRKKSVNNIENTHPLHGILLQIVLFQINAPCIAALLTISTKTLGWLSSPPAKVYLSSTGISYIIYSSAGAHMNWRINSIAKWANLSKQNAGEMIFSRCSGVDDRSNSVGLVEISKTSVMQDVFSF